jgi:Leucine-rich repeat (LRR) protein
MSYAAAQQKIAQAKAEAWTELDLAGLELEELPPELWELEQLEVLVLGKFDREKGKWIGNQLSSLPDAIVHLTNLQRLDLTSNQLRSVPEAIVHLSKLQTLFLSENQLSSLQRQSGTSPTYKSFPLGEIN